MKKMKRLMIRKALMYFLCFSILMSVAYTGNVSMAAAEDPAPQPALVNPGFELPLQNGSIPGWTQTMGTGSTGNVTVTSAVYHSGINSLKLEDNGAGSLAVESRHMKVTPGNKYRASSRVNLEGGSVQLQL